ncbi:MAG: RNA polymerase sigma factor [Armatimonadetes bacterium]|nr:RNA polymerase sigma factor [Armatimonadota bacterium]
MSGSITQSDAMVEEAVDIDFPEARRLYQSLVFAFVSRRVRPVEEAEDVTAEVFANAFRHWKRRKGEPRLWLLGIARRKIADSYRRRKDWSIRGSEEPSADLFAEFVANFVSQQAMRALFSLPDEERDALSMQVLEEMSIAEIAEVIGRTYPATNSLLQRARNRVRDYSGRATEGETK